MTDCKVSLLGADYHDKFDPRMYLQLKERYLEVDMEFHRQLHYSCKQGMFKGERLLELGEGPGISRLIAATTYFSEIVFSDYTASCREEVRKWIENREDAYDWSRHFKFVADLKGNGLVTMIPDPLEPITCDPFDGIIVASCLEAACPDIASFESSVKAVSSILKPGGVVIHWGRLGGNFCKVGDAQFHALTTTEEIVREAYKQAGFTMIHSVNVGNGGDDLQHLADAKNYLFIVARKQNVTHD
ncbi:nicotinamide N-methyltransferase-like [Saccoglossus kowalevskii]|uniref:Nicotinamide N-methyltransferase-like n=1 Tax=Saccoglossus kowalevskii TaxID=10224 RepID=A0ABM0M0U8_SACKO|nr:PREDICTED: nicotinamide N-methyltransferase-like [Saccoglossus kowalevskii]